MREYIGHWSCPVHGVIEIWRCPDCNKRLYGYNLAFDHSKYCPQCSEKRKKYETAKMLEGLPEEIAKEKQRRALWRMLGSLED